MTTEVIDGTTYFLAPRATLIAAPAFLAPHHLPVAWVGPHTAAEQLIEFAGRLCYMSQANPAGKDATAYIGQLLEAAHGSVLEHAQFSFLLEGISRSCTHELVRHRAGFAFSQLSQRYVDESDTAFVVPPALLPFWSQFLGAQWRADRVQDVAAYTTLVKALMPEYVHLSPTDQRKKAREAARSVLPNATETKIVVSANLRAWRGMLEQRTAAGAEAEMRRLARAILERLMYTAPAVFQDVVITENAVTWGFHKV